MQASDNRHPNSDRLINSHAMSLFERRMSKNIDVLCQSAHQGYIGSRSDEPHAVSEAPPSQPRICPSIVLTAISKYQQLNLLSKLLAQDSKGFNQSCPVLMSS